VLTEKAVEEGFGREWTTVVGVLLVITKHLTCVCVKTFEAEHGVGRPEEYPVVYRESVVSLTHYLSLEEGAPHRTGDVNVAEDVNAGHAYHGVRRG